MIGELSADTRKLQNPRSQKVADLMTEFGLMELLHHFWKTWWYRNVKIRPRERQDRRMHASSD